MKHFKLIGPKTTREFDILEDEMVVTKIIKIKDFENNDIVPTEYDEKNVKITRTETIWPNYY